MSFEIIAQKHPDCADCIGLFDDAVAVAQTLGSNAARFDDGRSHFVIVSRPPTPARLPLGATADADGRRFVRLRDLDGNTFTPVYRDELHLDPADRTPVRGA